VTSPWAGGPDSPSRAASFTPAEQFVATAAGLARDWTGCANCALACGSGWRRSPLLDAGRFTRELEWAYRQMWRVTCAGGGV